MTPYEEYLCACAKYEVHQLKESGQKFVLDKDKFDPTEFVSCFYGQAFGSSKGDRAMKFKKDNKIRLMKENCTFTALEELMDRLWNKDKKEQVYKIVEQFATWKQLDEEANEENLFTL